MAKTEKSRDNGTQGKKTDGKRGTKLTKKCHFRLNLKQPELKRINMSQGMTTEAKKGVIIKGVTYD